MYGYIICYHRVTRSTSGQQDLEEPHAVTSPEYELVDRGSDGVYSEITAIKTSGKKEYSMSECVAYAPTSEVVARVQ